MLWLLLLLFQLLATGWSLQQAAPSTFLWGGPQLWRLHLQRKYQRPPGDHKSWIFDDKFTYAAQVHMVGEDVTTVRLCHVRAALSICFKIFLLFFPLTRNLFSGLNFLSLISSAWLMHEGKGPKMVLCHCWSAGDLPSFPCKPAPGCPRLDLATPFSFGCSTSVSCF